MYHNIFRAAGDPRPYWAACYGVFSIDVCIQHDKLLWCFQYQTYVYSMISYYGVFSIRRMYTAWSVIMVFSVSDLYMYKSWLVIMEVSSSDVCIQHAQLLWCFQYQTYSCIQHGPLLWCFQYQTYVYSMISYYGVFSIRRMYTAWSVSMVFSVSDVCIQHDQLLWCFQHQTYVYSMISYYGVFSIRRMYTAWSVIVFFQHQTYVYSMISYYDVFSIRPIHDCVQHAQLLSPAMAKPWGKHRHDMRPSVHPCVRACVRPSQSLLAR